MRTRLAEDRVVVVRLIVLVGRVVDTLATYIATTRPDLVVMTTHGRHGLARFWLGSIADGLVRHINVPLLLVRPSPDHTEAVPKELFIRIIVPLDGSALAEAILPSVLALGDLMPARYTLVSVVEPFISLDEELSRRVPSPAHQQTRHLAGLANTYLESVAERLRAEGRLVQTAVRLGPHPATAILDEAGRQEADLIAMATHGRSGLRRFQLGSVTDKVLRSASAPVLMLRPPEPKAA